jgi:hypothetical protein
MINEESTLTVDEQENPKLKGKKSMRGEPEMYDEIKEIVSHSLTPTARKGLEILSKGLGISRSEVVEQVGRGRLRVTGLEPLYEKHSDFFNQRA